MQASPERRLRTRSTYLLALVIADSASVAQLLAISAALPAIVAHLLKSTSLSKERWPCDCPEMASPVYDPAEEDLPEVVSSVSAGNLDTGSRRALRSSADGIVSAACRANWGEFIRNGKVVAQLSVLFLGRHNNHPEPDGVVRRLIRTLLTWTLALPRFTAHYPEAFLGLLSTRNRHRLDFAAAEAALPACVYHVPVHSLVQRVSPTFGGRNSFRAGDRVGVAVSGGIDSVALLAVAA